MKIQKTSIILIILISFAYHFIPLLINAQSNSSIRSSSSHAFEWYKTVNDTSSYCGIDVETDNLGYLYILSSSNSLFKSNSSGGILWEVSLNIADGRIYGAAISVDNSDFIYVTGYHSQKVNSTYDRDMILFQYDSTGNLKWYRTWNASKNDYGNSVTVDKSGNVYVAGYYEREVIDGYTSDYDVILLKYDLNGNLLWLRTWNGSNSDYGNRVAVDNSGNVYVTGKYYNEEYYTDMILLKYDSSGVFFWMRSSCTSGYDEGNDIVIDNLGNVYVTSDILKEVFIYKYNSSGNSI